MSQSPFPGPQPYRAADRGRFFGRDVAVRKLSDQILARAATTVFGPSGAGKSSLMQAGVIPALEDSDGLRVVRVDVWPSDKAPLAWLVDAMSSELGLGASPEDMSPLAALEDAIDRAERRSDRPILIYLDQIEQLFVAERPEEEMKALLEGLDRLIQVRRQDVHLVLSVREDYLGRLHDWARERAELSAHGFRVGPLSVGEMVKAMCRTAAGGEPPQRWDEGEIRDLMLEVRVPGLRKTDAAEVQTAFAQIVCRALWEDRAAGRASETQGADAEAILRRYLDATVEGLGGLQKAARRLLEEHLIDKEGNRRLLTEKEARQVLRGDEAPEVLRRLEQAAVLRAEGHQGSRYFELGHDWLAKKVLERRISRKKEEAEKRRLAEEARRRKVRWTIVVSYLLVLVAFAVTVGWSFWALRAAERDAELFRGAYVPLDLRVGEILAAQNVFVSQLNIVATAQTSGGLREWIELALRTRPLAFAQAREVAKRGLASDKDPQVRRFYEEVAGELTAVEKLLGSEPERFSQLYQALAAGDRAAAETTQIELVKREAQGTHRIRMIRASVQERMESLTADAKQRELRSMQLLVGLGLLTLLVGFITSLYARRALAALSSAAAHESAVARGAG